MVDLSQDIDTTAVQAAAAAESDNVEDSSNEGSESQATQADDKTNADDGVKDVKAESQDEVKIDHEQIIKSLSQETSQESEKPQPGNFDKGLARLQEKLGKTRQETESIKNEISEIKQLIQGLANPQAKSKDPFEGKAGDDIVDVGTLQKGLEHGHSTLKKELEELKNLHKETVKRMEQQTVTPQQESQIIQKMAPDLPKEFSDHIRDSSNKRFEEFLEQHPNASPEWRQHEGVRIVNSEAQKIRDAIAKARVSSSDEKPDDSKPKQSTKIVDKDASTATGVEIEPPILNSADAEEKWIGKVSEMIRS